MGKLQHQLLLADTPLEEWQALLLSAERRHAVLVEYGDELIPGRHRAADQAELVSAEIHCLKRRIAAVTGRPIYE